MNRLVAGKKGGIEIAIDIASGEQYITIVGYCRLTGLNNNTVRKRCQRLIERQLSGKGEAVFKIEAKPLHWSDAMRSVRLKTKKGVFRTLLIPMECAAKWLKKDKPELVADVHRLIGEFNEKWEKVNK